MIAIVIVVCEIMFWVILAAGLATRYILKKPRLGAFLLLCVPLIDLVLLSVSAIDIANGATANWTHALAAAYLGFSIVFGHTMVKWLDARFAHRYADGPPPIKAPKYGPAKVRYEWKIWLMTVAAWAIACALLMAGVWLVDDPSRTAALSEWAERYTFVLGICTIWAVSWTIWPGKAPEAQKKH